MMKRMNGKLKAIAGVCPASALAGPLAVSRCWRAKTRFWWLLVCALAFAATALDARAADGDFVWARAVGGTSSEGVNAVAGDSAGNVYITGNFRDTVDFDPGPATVNLTSAGGGDIFVQKLDASGNLVWARRMGGTQDDLGNAIAVDGLGNVYTTGSFRVTADFDPGSGTVNLTSAGFQDAFVQKLDANGDLVWVRAIGGNFGEVGDGAGVDSAGNV